MFGKLITAFNNWLNDETPAVKPRQAGISGLHAGEAALDNDIPEALPEIKADSHSASNAETPGQPDPVLVHRGGAG